MSRGWVIFWSVMAVIGVIVVVGFIVLSLLVGSSCP